MFKKLVEFNFKLQKKKKKMFKQGTKRKFSAYKNARTRFINPYKIRKVTDRGTHKGELKWLDTTMGTATTTAGTATTLSTMAAGAGKNARVGDEVTVKMVRVKGFIKGVTAESVVRCMICQGDSITITNILATPLFEDQMNLSQRSDWHILADESFSVGVQSVTTTANPQSGFPGLVPFDLIKKFPKGLKMRYSSDANGYPAKNGLFFLAICGVSTTQGAPLIVASGRIRYTDN